MYLVAQSSVSECLFKLIILPCHFFGPGEHLRLCPQDYTCCSSQMEETLALQSERDFLKAVEDSSQFLLTTFTQRYRRFDGKKMNFYVFLLSV